MTLRRCATAVATSLALAACGGGGDGDPGFPADIVFDVAAAWSSVLNADAAFSLSGVGSDNFGYTLVVDLQPFGTGAYPPTGQVWARSIQRSSLSSGNTLLSDTQTTQFFDPATNELIAVASSDGTCADIVSNGVLPRAANVGSVGVLYDAVIYDSCSPSAAAEGSVASRWSIEAEAGVPFFCVNSEQRDAFGNAIAAEQDCIEVDSLGRLGALARMTVVVHPSAAVPGGFSLVARNY